MVSIWQQKHVWAVCFGCIVLFYGLYYAPYGLNETDGGFLTGLAWQIRSGKTLYADVIYVRPPLPVWLRAVELSLLPEHWAILGERWLFYLKVAVYAGLAAAVLASGMRRWQLAILGFILSAHCYPAAAWHTVDGILFGTLAIWSWTNGRGLGFAALSGLFMAAAVLCKQSFYPLPLAWAVMIFVKCPASDSKQPDQRRAFAFAFGAFLCSLAVFAFYLHTNGLWSTYMQLTTGAASSNDALQHGALDYFRIQPVLLVLSAAILLPAGWLFWRKQRPQSVFWLWSAWLLVLAGAYAWAIFQRQEFTAPFAQTRLLFCASAFWLIYRAAQRQFDAGLFALLALSWCASVSWGYNLPVLFTTPWVYTAWVISTRLLKSAYPERRPTWEPALAMLLILVLFRWAYAFIYRDGPREAMTEPLGVIFPALGGIYSDADTGNEYRELRDLAMRYGPGIKTLPSFPLANFLTRTRPPLPLDWVVAREMGRAAPLVDSLLFKTKPVLLIERTYLPRLNTDPELELTRKVLSQGQVVDSTAHFFVVRL